MRQSMISMVPKFTGAAYFAATEKGAKEAVAELRGKGVAIDFLYTGPSVANTDEQIRIIDDLVAQKPDAIIIAPNHADALVPVAKKAKTSGIKVIAYDADVADPSARQWFVNQGTFTLAGAALVDVVAEQAGASARFAVVSTDPGAFSQNSWIAAMKAQMQAKYPKMQLVDIGYGLGKPAESFSVAQDLISQFRGQLDAIVAPTVVALPKVAEAVEEAGAHGQDRGYRDVHTQRHEGVRQAGHGEDRRALESGRPGLLGRLRGSGQSGGHARGQCDAGQGAGRTVGHARRGRSARGHHGQGSAHAEERDRVGESVPVHDGQYRPVQLLSRLEGGFKAEAPRKSRRRHGRQ